MDRTEVTQSQYALFVAHAQNHPEVLDWFEGQHPICKIPFELVKRTPGPEDDVETPCRASLFNPEKHPDNAVVCTSHCAARLYCRWAGKELCGSPKGGPVPWDQEAYPNPGETPFKPETNAWMNACTNGGKTEVAVEKGVGSGKCTPVNPQDKTFPSVESQPDCHSSIPPFDQVLGLGGGVREWQDSCGESSCLVGGARYVGTATPPYKELQELCKNGGSPTGPSEDVGFRCCLPLASP